MPSSRPKNDLSKTAANAILDTLIDTIQTAVKNGDAVQLVGFGTFKSAKRAASAGKNPATVAALEIPASTVRSSWQVPSSSGGGSEDGQA